MAKDNEVLIELKIVQKGNKLSVVAKETDKVTKAQERQAKSNKKVAKTSEGVITGQKGISQTGLSSAKGFSKMNSMLNGGGGSSGLVAAYATLAANVFAATAAFNAFRSAAAFEQLTEGFTFMANESGRTMDLVVAKLKEVTGGALSTEEALQGASLAVSGGFSIETLEKLAKVAKGASLALGRNLNDAFDRLTRGAIKLEPEILDELGIMVRLDDATEKYAATINKTAKDLTQFERQTAFINAINEQGIEKYGALADAVDVNPYDKLAATFGDLTKSMLQVINVALIPLAEFFSQSPGALGGLMVIFGSTILTTMVPALGQMVKRSKDVARANIAIARSTKSAAGAEMMRHKATMLANRKTTKSTRDLMAALVANKNVKAVAIKTELNLERQLATAQKAAAKMTKKEDAEKLVRKQARIAQIEAEIIATKALGTAEVAQLSAGLVLDQARVVAKTSKIVAQGIGTITSAGALGGFKAMGKSIGMLGASLFGTHRSAIKSAKSMSFFTRATTLASGSMKLFGAAFITALPMIGAVIIAISAAVLLYKHFTKEQGDASEAVTNLAVVAETMGEKFEQLNTKMEGMTAGAKIISEFNVVNGIITEINGNIKKGIDDINTLPVVEAPVMGESSVGPMSKSYNNEMVNLNKAYNQDLAAFKEYNETKARIVKDVIGGVQVALKKAMSESDMIGLDLVENLMTKAFGPEVMKSAGGLAEAIDGIDVSMEGLEGLSTTMGDTARITGNVTSSMKNLKAGITAADTVFSKFFQSLAQKTEFDELIKQIDGLQVEMTLLNNDPNAGAEVVKESFKKMGAQLKKFGVTADNASTRLPILVKAMRASQKISRTLKTDLAALNQETTLLGVTKKLSGNSMKEFLTQSQKAIDLQQTANDAEKVVIDLMDDSLDKKTRQGILDASNYALQLKRLTTLQIETRSETEQLSINKAKLAVEQATQQSIEKQLTAQRMMAQIRKGQGSTLGIDEQFAAGIDAAQKEVDRATERKVLEDKIVKNKRISNIADIQSAAAKMGIMTQGQAEAITAQLKLLTLDLLRNDANLNAKREELRLAKLLGIESESMYTAAMTMFAEMKTDAGFGLAAAFALINIQISPFIDSLKEMGPEGSALAGAMESILATTTLIIGLKDSIALMAVEFGAIFAEMGDDNILAKMGLDAGTLATTVGALDTVSNLLGTMMAITKADAATKTAEIERQIEAEKRLDGTSSASVAKMKGLEKEKQNINRKAFEENKKLQVAQAVISTISAALQAQAAFGFPIGTALAAMIMSIGMKQVGMIKATQYGGDTPSPEGAKISIGKRSDSVDTAQSASAGELSYLRGNRGVGSNANDFVSGGAAGMRKSYANGGDILVGERGPEVIRPDSQGYDVIPNDRLGGGVSNVNFSINAVDAEGVEELLINQRGNIIRMIREAANENGEIFMEGIDTQTYGSNT